MGCSVFWLHFVVADSFGERSDCSAECGSFLAADRRRVLISPGSAAPKSCPESQPLERLAPVAGGYRRAPERRCLRHRELDGHAPLAWQ